MTQRHLVRTIRGLPTSDGAGVKLTRSLGQSDGARLDPFLMLDEIASESADDYIAGFPPHPHRGFETVTYMLDGRMRHKDHLGNSGLLESGGVQWMTAARGIIHSEMPEQKEGRLHGFQLWINLPAAEKMKDPRYEDISPAEVPEVELQGGGVVRVVAGRVAGPEGDVEGPVRGISTQPLFLDIRLPEATAFDQAVPAGHNAFLYVYQGALRVEGGNGSDYKRIVHGEAGVLSDGDRLSVTAEEVTGALLLAARPIGEPVVQYGPFVMTSREEIEQALRDYRDGTLAAGEVEGIVR
ncbi:MAG: pirin family protein [Ectothiorhodospiraceae bacterium]|jgi:hypothetical protein